MKKVTIEIPAGVKYLSEVDGFELPNGIFNKVLTGCGATTIALVDNNPTIICSPRNALLSNKAMQYPNVLWFKPGMTDADLNRYIDGVDVPKILVTYDSIKRLSSMIDVNSYRLVVDEFQRLLTDSSFKSEVEMKFISSLSKFNYVTYLSATPILDKYLDAIGCFDDITYYEANWQSYDKVLVSLIKSPNPRAAMVRIINDYKAGVFTTIDMSDGTKAVSKEAVFYVNSVTDICNVIKTCGLTADECNILCSTSKDNEALVRKIGKRFGLGAIPAKGEECKMFTFCTSAAYDGVDMYSTNASTYVVSDYRVNNLLMDIRTDLVQIAGRQRLVENPFSNTLVYIYSEGIDIADIEELRRRADIKLSNSIELMTEDNNSKLLDFRLNSWAVIPPTVRFVVNYCMPDDTNSSFIVNKMVYLNEKYKIDLFEDFLKNGVKKAIGSEPRFTQLDDVCWVRFIEKIKYTIERTEFVEKFSDYCEVKKSASTNDGDKGLLAFMECGSKEFKRYYDILGYDKCKALNFQKSKLDNYITKSLKTDEMFKKIYFRLSNGFISCSELKSIMQAGYDELGIKQKAKASDILDCNFITAEAKSLWADGKMVKGFVLSNIKYSRQK